MTKVWVQDVTFQEFNFGMQVIKEYFSTPLNESNIYQVTLKRVQEQCELNYFLTIIKRLGVLFHINKFRG